MVDSYIYNDSLGDIDPPFDFYLYDDLHYLSEPQNCPICIQNKTLISMPCGHSFCKECLSSYLEIKIIESDVLTLTCPECTLPLQPEFIRNLTSEEVFKKFQKFLEAKNLEKNILVKWCPQPDCKGYDTASDKNQYLTCSECGFKYCYVCSKPWHKGKCNLKQDIGFEFWALGNNVKICPRCKNYVQKNGGCPHMSCPRCQFQWCWICGKDYNSPNHNAFTCYVGSSPLDLYWAIIIWMLLFPITIPFLFFFLVVYSYESEGFERDSLKGIFACFRYRIVAYLLALVFSPAVEILALVVAFFGMWISIASKHNYNAGFLEWIFRLIIGLTICSLIFVTLALGLGLLVVVMPVCGCFFFLTKLYYSVKKCFRPSGPVEYPRLFG